MAYMDALLPVDKERYINKLNSIGLDSCPYVIKDWTLRSEMVSVPVFREAARFSFLTWNVFYPFAHIESKKLRYSEMLTDVLTFSGKDNLTDELKKVFKSLIAI